jgi:hypothetical protein
MSRMAGKMFIVKFGQEIKKLSSYTISHNLALRFINSLVLNMFPVFGLSWSLLQLMLMI